MLRKLAFTKGQPYISSLFLMLVSNCLQMEISVWTRGNLQVSIRSCKVKNFRGLEFQVVLVY